jgi:type I restriction enzyme S subunit
MENNISGVAVTLSKFNPRWRSDRLATLFAENKALNYDCVVRHALQFKYGDIISKPKTKVDDSLLEIWKKYTIVQSGDIMINGLNLNYDFVSFRIGLVKEEGIITSAYISLRPRKGVNAKFYNYYFKALDSQKVFHGLGTGIRLTLSYKEIKNMMLPIPTKEEQEQIVKYLDWKVSEINKLISVKEKQVSSYRDLRKAVIDKGILHGFKDTAQKDSEVYWLGKIPATWEVVLLKHVCRVNASISDVVKTMDDTEMVTFLPMENVSEIGDLDCSIKRPISDVRSGFSSFAKGDVVVAKITPCFENGKGACLDELDTEIGFGSSEFINLRPSNIVLSRYLYMITMTQPFRKLGEEVMTGSAGQKRVPVNYIKNFTIGIPPIEEQRKILAEIDTRLVQIDKAMQIELQEIELLQELKMRIISDVVTGKIDVRGIKIPDYEFVAESVEDEIDEDIFDEQENDI